MAWTSTRDTPNESTKRRSERAGQLWGRKATAARPRPKVRLSKSSRRARPRSSRCRFPRYPPDIPAEVGRWHRARRHPEGTYFQRQSDDPKVGERGDEAGKGRGETGASDDHSVTVLAGAPGQVGCGVPGSVG